MASRKTNLKSMNFSRRKRAAACFLTASGPVITKTADRKTIMNKRGQTRKTIIDYHEEFEQAQTEARAQLSSTIIDYHEPFDKGFRL